MNKMKIFAVAAGFVAAAGITTAGNIYVGTEQVGTYTGNVTVTGTGDIRFPSGTDLGSNDGSPTNEPSCGLNAHVNSAGTGCECDSGYIDPFDGDTSVNENVNCEPGETTTPPPEPSDCGATPANFSRASSPTSISSFPGVQGTKEQFEIRRGEYAAIQFTAPSTTGTYGKMHFISDTFAPNGSILMTISQCPGDFRPLNGQSTCRKGPGGTIGFWWSAGSVTYTCEMQPGGTYYLNLIYAKGSGNDLVNTCDFSSCGHLMQWDNY